MNVEAFDVPLISQPPVNPLVYGKVLDDGIAPHATVIGPGAVIVGSAAGLTVITLDTDARALPHISVAVHVSVTVPPQASGVAVNVEAFDVPLISQPPVNPLVYGKVLDDGIAPHATVIGPGAVIVGSAAGLTVITLDTDARALPHISVAVHVSAPHATVIGPGAVIVGSAAGLTVITLDTDARALPHISVAVHVSVTVPPQASGVAVNVEAFDVPLISQPPVNPLVYGKVLDDGIAPHATVIGPGAVIVGSAAGLTVITLDTDARALPHISVAVHVSVTVPPQASGVAVNVEAFDVPLISQPPVNPLVYGKVLDDGIAPHATVIGPGAVIVGSAAGLTVITLDTDARALPHISVAVHVSVTVPPQASGVAVNVEAFDVPLISQPPVNPLVYGKVLDDGIAPHATVIGPGAVIVGSAAGLTVITLDTDARALPHISVAVHVSVTVPPQASGVAVNVEAFDVPLISQPPVNPLVYGKVLDDGIAPHATVIGPGAVIVGSAAGLTVITLDTDARALPHISVAVHVSVTVPPQASGVAVNVEAFDVPLISQPPVNPLVYGKVLDDGIAPHATVIGPGAVIVGSAAGLTVITLDTDARALPHISVAVHVSVTVPPQASGVAVNVEAFDVPLISQPPVNPLVYGKVLDDGIAPHATVIGPGAVIVGSAAGLTVITLDTDARALPHISVAVHVSVTVPPQASGVAVNVEAFDVPLISQPPVNPLVYGKVLDDGIAPHATVIGPGAVIVGSAAGLTVITLDTDARALPHISVAVHVSVTVPPQASGVAVNVEAFDVPLISQPPVNPLVYGKVLDDGIAPHATVIGPGAVIVGSAAGLTVITLDTDARALPHISVAVHVSVTVPPQASGVAVNVEAFDVPLISQPPVNPLVYGKVLDDGIAPHATVIGPGAVIVGSAAGLTVITLDTDARALPHISVAVHVSVTVPPQASGVAVNVEAFDVPLISQPPVNPLVYGKVLDDGIAPHATVIGPGAVIVGSAAGKTVIV